MSRSETDKLSLASKAEAALLQAAKRAVRDAQRTDTPLVVWENGKVTEIPASRFEVEQGETTRQTKGQSGKRP